MQALVSEYISAHAVPETKALALLDRIDAKMLARHEKLYPSKPTGAPLLLLNPRRPVGCYACTGLLLTDEVLAFKTTKDAVLSSLWWRKGRSEVMPLSDVRSFQIGRHDRCLGSNYVGHQLIVNGEVMGLVRMGRWFTLDAKAITAINGFAQFLFDKGVAETPPREHAWQ